MFKNVVAPIQAWLLSQKKCVGCGRELPQPGGEGLVKVTCICGRIYMYDPVGKKYRRATFDETK